MVTFTAAIPPKMTHLPVDKRGYPVPKFVEWIEGQPDFRVMDPRHMGRCIRVGVCWICGERLGRHQAFVIGPMCCINRISSEPPSHYECAAFAAKVCPFLTRPAAKRRQANMPGETMKAGGVMLEHNPGLTAIWMTSGYDLIKTHSTPLFRLREPDRIEFYREGRRADRAEVNAAIKLGLPNLLRVAEDEDRHNGHWKLGAGPSVKELQRQVDAFTARLAKHLPMEAA